MDGLTQIVCLHLKQRILLDDLKWELGKKFLFSLENLAFLPNLTFPSTKGGDGFTRGLFISS